MTEETAEESPWQKSEARFNRYVQVPRPPQIIQFGVNLKLTDSSKRYSEYFDPCQEAATRSVKCIHRNGGDREFCADYFESVYLISVITTKPVMRSVLTLRKSMVDQSVALANCFH